MSDLSPSILQTRLADLVQDDPRITPVLDRFGLDYCCRGYRTLQEASIDEAVPVSEILEQLEAIGPRPVDATLRRPGRICAPDSAHRHQASSLRPRASTGVGKALLDKLVKRHGAGHPELVEVRQVFSAVRRDAAAHEQGGKHSLSVHRGALRHERRGAAAGESLWHHPESDPRDGAGALRQAICLRACADSRAAISHRLMPACRIGCVLMGLRDSNPTFTSTSTWRTTCCSRVRLRWKAHWDDVLELRQKAEGRRQK